MKAKLLKKLRKRFNWKKESPLKAWTLIDKKTNKEIYAFVPCFFFYNDMAIYEMMNIIGLRFLFKKRTDRIYDRQIKRCYKAE